MPLLRKELKSKKSNEDKDDTDLEPLVEGMSLFIIIHSHEILLFFFENCIKYEISVFSSFVLFCNVLTNLAIQQQCNVTVDFRDKLHANFRR